MAICNSNITVLIACTNPLTPFLSVSGPTTDTHVQRAWKGRSRTGSPIKQHQSCNVFLSTEPHTYTPHTRSQQQSQAQRRRAGAGCCELAARACVRSNCATLCRHFYIRTSSHSMLSTPVAAPQPVRTCRPLLHKAHALLNHTPAVLSACTAEHAAAQAV